MKRFCFDLSRELIKERKSQGADAVGRMVRGHAKCLGLNEYEKSGPGNLYLAADYLPFGSIVKAFLS